MTPKETTMRPVNTASLIKHLLVGTAIALAVISFFVFGVDEPNPAWPALWRVRPLIITPLAGAAGGACFYFIDHLLNQNGRRKALAVILGILVFIIGLWMGIVLGLDGTMWD